MYNVKEITVFRVIAARIALDESESPDEVYDKLDEMTSFRPKRTNDRGSKPKQEPQEDVPIGDIILASH